MRAWALALLAGCGVEATPPVGTQSTTILLDSEGLVWLTSPDDDQLVAVDSTALAVVQRHATGPAPSHLAAVPGGWIVTHALSGRVLRIQPPAAPDMLELPCRSGGPVVALGELAVVGCPLDDRLVAVDLAAFAVAGQAATPAHPQALAVVGDTLFVGDHRGGVATHRFDVGLTPLTPPASPPRPPGQATRVVALAPAGRGVAALRERLTHDGDRDAPPQVGSYGALPPEGPRVEPHLEAPHRASPRYTRFEDPARRHSGPVALAAADGRWWIVHRGSASVAVLDVDGEPVARFAIGEGARGLALTADGAVAFVDVGFDHAVARLDLATGTVRAQARTTGPRRLSAAAERGRRLFHDARGRRIGPADVLSCATCHPDGQEDGLTWFVHTPTIAPKLRRTPPAWGGRPALAPYHADGEFPDLAALAEATFRDLMGGTGLGLDLDALGAYLAEVPLPPPGPPTDGGEVFAAAGCAECHPAPFYTDGRSHALELGTAEAPLGLAAVVTPSLVGVGARSPYLHDGSAPRLIDVLARHAPPLSAAEAAALVRWLEAR